MATRAPAVQMLSSTSQTEEVGRPKRKDLGAYYTSEAVADFLVRWAVRSAKDTVLDPSFGGGVFLKSAETYLHQLGGQPERQIYGIEIDHDAFRNYVGLQVEAPPEYFLRSDFFDIEAGTVPPVDAVVGNPPFIRYQRFSGRQRELALGRAAEAGVQLSKLSSSWAPFLIHATQFVVTGGRIAVVAPAEIVHAMYARPVLRYLRQSFGRVRLVCFARRLFPHLSEDVVLVLGERRGDANSAFDVLDLKDASDLPSLLAFGPSARSTYSLGDHESELSHSGIMSRLLPEDVRQLYKRLEELSSVFRLSAIAGVGIGYVTGENDFFHLDRQRIDEFQVPWSILRRAARRGADLAGLRFSDDDWQSQHDRGHGNALLLLSGDGQLPGCTMKYLEQGEARGVHLAYKCRIRSPWYQVPHVHQADCFLTYMSGSAPKLVANCAGAVAPNTLLTVQLRPDKAGAVPNSLVVAASAHTSLTALSFEVEGHSLGGGMLKLEPSEAEKTLMAIPSLSVSSWASLSGELDRLVRGGKAVAARDLADKVILHDSLGLDQQDILTLREGHSHLQRRRLDRSCGACSSIAEIRIC